AEFLAKTVAPSRIDDVRLVAGLCKCDLVTHMIKEFPSLQGVMGEEYASREGYDEEICLAIHEHYLPIRAGGQLPTSLIGALVGLADRMDTIAGCFAVGLLPSGSADPFALRRHALAIIRVLEEMQWGLSLEAFIGKALDILGEDIEFDGGLVFSAVTGFFRERYKQMALRLGYESELVESVISVGFDRIDQLQPRLGQLRKFASESEEFQAVVLTSKRVKNILKNQERPFGVDPGLFNESCESTLWMAFKALKDDIERCLENGEYYRSAMLMAGLRKPVDEFFEGVEVLTRDDMTLRQNRVGLLQHISRLFLCVADFSVFSI
ncbi:MAG: glycine--tRNA ligase subunit beta, partial [Thermodesulfobacteriota bacterium]|nr:glycine--tRNA ligase subunit beta [Thermodesulfobacteriota bacterium]